MRWWKDRFTGLVNTHHDSLVTGTELLHRFRARGVSLGVSLSVCVSLVGECMESGHGKAEAEAEAGGGVNRWWWWCVGDPMKLICRFQAGLEWRHRAVRECALEESR